MTVSLEGWFVCWHPRGAFRTQSVREHIAMNKQKCMDGADNGYLVVGLADSMEEAAELERQLKRQKRDQANDEFGPVPLQ